jgi:hypothetical protein
MPENTPPELAAAVDDFVARACAKNPDERHPNALVMQTELNAMLRILDQHKDNGDDERHLGQ